MLNEQMATLLVRFSFYVLFLLFFARSGPAQTAVERTDKILLQGNAAGTETVRIEADGTTRAEYSYNDRGRGEHIVATWKVDQAGVLLEYEGKGNDYMKASVEENFAIRNGTASWKNRGEDGKQALQTPAFYVPVSAPPELTAVLARALLKSPNHKLPLLPAGEASLEESAKVTVRSGTNEFTLYRIVGLEFQPQSVWLDRDGNLGGSLSTWFSVIPSPYESAMAEMLAAQQKADEASSQLMAQETSRTPRGDLLIQHARLFDPRDLSVTPEASVLIHGDRVVRVSTATDSPPAKDAEVIDAGGQFLMPGLWDNHQHFANTQGAMDLANGVTCARDMANDTEAFLKRVERFDAGTELGPMVLKAGIIDGTGEFAGPTKMRIDTADQARQDVDWYADHGYVQIKIYSSVKPELVPVIADRAHGRGLRVSGHVPAFMSAKQFVEQGADEIQHLNFIELNFLFPEVKETRNRDRFIKVAEHAREFTPDKPMVQDFINFLKRHHTVLDPTMNVFEGLFCGDPTKVTPGLEEVVPRFPAQIRRSLLSGALPVPQGQETNYREAFPSMLQLLKASHDAGVIIVPGTDAVAGYSFHHELELYVRAGIPAAEVLRMATLTSATVMGVNKDRGVIAPGKIADMVLVKGDPTKNISDIRKITKVIKAGKIYDPIAIEKSLGITPRQL